MSIEINLTPRLTPATTVRNQGTSPQIAQSPENTVCEGTTTEVDIQDIVAKAVAAAWQPETMRGLEQRKRRKGIFRLVDRRKTTPRSAN